MKEIFSKIKNLHSSSGLWTWCSDGVAAFGGCYKFLGWGGTTYTNRPSPDDSEDSCTGRAVCEHVKS
jgi:hypothetical protein